MPTTHTSFSTANMSSGVAGRSRAQLALQPYESFKTGEKYLLASSTNGFLLSDTKKVDSSGGLWTDNPDDAQVYYDLVNAFDKAKILSDMTDEVVQVKVLA